ncbi:MAG TPA: extracellular solute-binding protein [Pseudonocardia sp.]|nr:extracellular solute-binding protein [Pseudonocardia sp.]
MVRLSTAQAAGALFLVAGLAMAGCVGGGGQAAPPLDPQRGAGAKDVTLVISANDAQGGKNADEADWIVNYVIPEFTKQEAAKGVKATVTFQPSGVDDEQFKTRLSLDMRTGGGADIVTLDGIWVGEFAEAGYLRPLADVVGPAAAGWDGWAQIPSAVQQLGTYDGKRYGIPYSTDGRVLYFNKELFARAGLPADWQPHSWQDVLDAGAKLKALPGVDPIQLNAGTAMGEATTMQGVLPLLAGTGTALRADDGKWQGDTAAVRDVLGLYQKVYAGGLGDAQLQLDAKGRDKSFTEFAAGKVGILLESDYFWRSVVEPRQGTAPMADRDQVVGFAKIPAEAPGKGPHGQDFVSMSGGGMRTVNPASKYPQQAWQLLQFMNSAPAVTALVGGTPRITQRTDVNNQTLGRDPLLTYISTQVLPLTAYRPSIAEYPQVSQALQQATDAILAGTPPDQAAKKYGSALEGVLGGAGDITSN